MDGSWTFTQDGDYLTVAFDGEDYTGLSFVMSMLKAVGNYLGMEADVMTGYVNGLNFLGIENDSFVMEQDEATGTTTVHINDAAPSCLVDQKAATRFVKYNILLGNLPGSVDYWVSTGGSGGGAHAAMFAATSNNPDFYDYQIEVGAVGVYSNGDGTYCTSGLGSPAIYSTADITVSNATLTSNLSEGVCIEGMNSITLVDCDMTANNTAMNGNATFLDTIMIYQSMSGDADSGESYFTMTGGSLTSKSGHMFHVTNTHAVITLTGVELVNEGSDILLSVCDDGWSGANNVATLNAVGQALTGTILVGDDSTLTLNLTEGSTFEGTFSGAIENAKGETISTEVGTVSVTLDDTSAWTLTADTYITEFNGDLANVNLNGYTLYVNGEAVA